MAQACPGDPPPPHQDSRPFRQHLSGRGNILLRRYCEEKSMNNHSDCVCVCTLKGRGRQVMTHSLTR